MARQLNLFLTINCEKRSLYYLNGYNLLRCPADLHAPKKFKPLMNFTQFIFHRPCFNGIWASVLFFLLAISQSTLAYAEDQCFNGHCVLVVNGKTYMNTPCGIETGDWGMQYSSDNSKYFGSVLVGEDGSAMGSWNGVEAENHAMDELGPVRHDGNCWIGNSAKICISNKLPRKCEN